LKNLQKIVETIKDLLEQQSIAEALQKVKILHEYKVRLEIVLPEILKQCKTVAGIIKHAFQKAYHYFVERFLESNTPTVVDNVAVRQTEKRFVCLMELLKFSRHTENRGTI
jgi:hypothetical protein